jgi:hypothetical protein
MASRRRPTRNKHNLPMKKKRPLVVVVVVVVVVVLQDLLVR